jgi:hypothetical protein
LAFLGLTLFFFSAHNASAQRETWEPATTGFETEVNVWTSNGITYAKVRLTFPNGGWRVDWGQVTRTGNTFTADAKVDRWTGISTQAITFKENTYNLGALSSGTYTFTFKSYGTTVKSQQFDPSLVVEHWEQTILPSSQVGVRIPVVSNGQFYLKVELYFPDTGYSVTDWGQLTRSGNDFLIDLKAEHFTGESQAHTTVVDHDYPLGAITSGTYSLTIKMYGTTVKTLTFALSVMSTPIPKLMTEENSERAIALDSVTWLRLFPLITNDNFSPDRRARIMLLVSNLELSPNENASAVTALAEDAQGKSYPLTVEYVGKVPNFDWLTQVIVKPPDELKGGGDVWISIGTHGVNSNRALVTLKPSSVEAQ